MEKLTIACEELVCVPTGHKVYTNVIFKPTSDTIASLDRAQASKQEYQLSVSDNGGDHTAKRPQQVISVSHEREVLIVMTREF